MLEAESPSRVIFVVSLKALATWRKASTTERSERRARDESFAGVRISGQRLPVWRRLTRSIGGDPERGLLTDSDAPSRRCRREHRGQRRHYRFDAFRDRIRPENDAAADR